MHLAMEQCILKSIYRRSHAISIPDLADKYGNTIHLGKEFVLFRGDIEEVEKESPSQLSVMNSERRWVRSQSKQRKQQNTTVQEQLNSYVTNMEFFLFIEMNTRIPGRTSSD